MKIPRWALVFAGLMIVAGAALGAWLVSQRAGHTFSGLVLDPPRPAASFQLVDEANQPFALDSLRGQWILLDYGYTSCPDVCPTTLNNLRQTLKVLGAPASQVRVVFVTVDPERDTVAQVGKYVHNFNPDFKALTGSLDQIAVAAKAYQVTYEKKFVASAEGYLMNHTAMVYLIDPQFRWRMSFPFGVKPEEMAADLQYLMTPTGGQP